MRLINFVLLMLLFTGTARAECLDAHAANSIREEFSIELSGVKKTDLCAENTRAYRLFQTLIFLKDIRFKNRNPDGQVDQGVLAQGFWKYLSAQGLRTINERNDPICRKSEVYAFVDQVKAPNTVSLCPLFFDAKVSVSDRAQSILHEVRHFLGYPHVDCRVGLWKGVRGGCDESIKDHGSYSVSAESMARVGLLSLNLSKAARASAKLLALSYAQTRFNQPVFKNGARAVYLTAADGNAYLFNGQKLYSVPTVSDAAIVSLQSTVNIFPKDRMDEAYTLNVFSRSESPVLSQSSITKLYNRLEPATRPEIVDVLSVGSYLCFIQPTLVTCSQPGGKAINYTSDRVLTRAFLPEELAINKLRETLLLVDDSNRIGKLTLKGKGLFEYSETGLRLDGFRTVVRFFGGRLALRQNGELVAEKNGAWVAVPEARGKAFQSLSRGFFWSPTFLED